MTRDRRFRHLTRHFFDALFDFGFLSDAGVRSFTRIILGICAALAAFGLLLVRVFMERYGSLARADSPEPYLQAIVADHAFLIAIPMWIVAFVTTLVGHALFPDETDFRILMGLPVTRRLVFGAKLAAIGLFTGIFVVAAELALGPLFLLSSFSSWAQRSWPAGAGAYLAASLMGSIFAMLLVVAIHGVLVLLAIRGRTVVASALVRSGMLCALVLALPFLFRLPMQARRFADGSSFLAFIPPAWFVGLEHTFAGDATAFLSSLSMLALAATGVVTVVAVASYAMLYRHFDRVMVRPAPSQASTLRRDRRIFSLPRLNARPIFRAIRTFVAITLRRSVFHQGIVVAISALGGGLVLNSLLNADLFGWMGTGEVPSRRLRDAVVWAPFPLMFVACFAVRTSLAVPRELRANWVFRLTERDAARADQLGAATFTARLFGVIVPVVLILPLQWLVLGPPALASSLVAIVAGFFLVELLMSSWERIPFTCAYAPGGGFVPQTILIAWISFFSFTTFGWALATVSLNRRPAGVVLTLIVVSIVLVLARRRRRRWQHTELVFDEQVPSEINPLRLN